MIAAATPGSTISFSGVDGKIVSLNSGLGPIEINKDLNIGSSGSLGRGVSIDGKEISRLFDIGIGHNVTFHSLHLTGGRTKSNGGAIYSEGNITMENCSIGDCKADRSGGAIYSEGVVLTLVHCSLGPNGTGERGGGIFQIGGSLDITHSTISSNSSGVNGGGIF